MKPNEMGRSLRPDWISQLLHIINSLLNRLQTSHKIKKRVSWSIKDIVMADIIVSNYH